MPRIGELGGLNMPNIVPKVDKAENVGEKPKNPQDSFPKKKKEEKDEKKKPEGSKGNNVDITI